MTQQHDAVQMRGRTLLKGRTAAAESVSDFLADRESQDEETHLSFLGIKQDTERELTLAASFAITLSIIEATSVIGAASDSQPA